MDKKEKLEKIVDVICNGKKREMANRLGMTDQAISSWFSRETFNPFMIAESFPEINPDWLLLDDNNVPMLKTDIVTQNVEHIINKEEEDTSLYLPLIPIDALAGYVTADNPGVMITDCDLYRVPEFTAASAEMIIRVSGDSMYPTYRNGDKLACRSLTDTSWLQWGRAYVLDTEQGALVKKVFEGRTDATVTCHSDNEKFPDFQLPKAAIRKMFIVLGVIRME